MTSCPQTGAQRCHCQPRPDITISRPFHITRLPVNEASPCWPSHIGNTGYAVHLFSLESQHSKAAIAQARAGDLLYNTSPHQATDNRRNASFPPTCRVCKGDYDWRGSSITLLGRGVSREQEIADERKRKEGRERRVCEIVDGSPEVLAEMTIEEDSGEGSSDTEVSGQKRGRALRRLGEKVRRLTRSL
jgi:hypothetical protein